MFITRRDKSGYEQRLFSHPPVHAFDLHYIAHLEGSRVSQQDSRQQITNDTAAAERHQRTNEH